MKHKRSYSLNEKIIKRIPVYFQIPGREDIISSLSKNEFEFADYVFLCNKDFSFKGMLKTITLLSTNNKKYLNQELSYVKPVSINDSLENTANHAVSQNKSCVPVEDENGKFIGIITAEIIIQTLKHEHTSDLHALAGIRQSITDFKLLSKQSAINYIGQRIPWLLTGVAGSSLASILMSNFKNILSEHLAIVFFIPGIVYLADAIGTQTETFTIRSMTLSKLQLKKILPKEIFSGISIGLILGIIGFIFCLFSNFGRNLSLVLLISLTFTGFLASITGVFLPWIISKLGMDPAYGSGPIATIVQDILSLLVYLTSAKIVFEF